MRSLLCGQSSARMPGRCSGRGASGLRGVAYVSCTSSSSGSFTTHLGRCAVALGAASQQVRDRPRLSDKDARANREVPWL